MFLTLGLSPSSWGMFSCRGLSAAKRKAADDHMNVVRRLAKKPAVAESDSQEWKEGVAAMETNLVSCLADSTAIGGEGLKLSVLSIRERPCPSPQRL